jgi:hypothetical protein
VDNIKSLASFALGAFTNKRRANGDNFLCLKDNAVDWVKDLVYKAHGEMAPDDYKYGYVYDALDCIADGRDPSEFDNVGEMYDYPEYLAERIEADIYTHDLYSWLSSNLTRAGYVDDYLEQVAPAAKDGIVEMIRNGQVLERTEVLEIVVQYLVDLDIEQQLENTAI